MFELKKAFAPLCRFLSAAIDCEVRQWGPWSPCSSVCGAGTTERSRQVATPPHNGGTPCPDLKQRRGCLAHTETCSSAKEVAKILPDSFRRNFKDPWRRPHMLMKEEKKRPWSARLVHERSVCIECQSDAMTMDNRCRGDGLQNIRTFWSAASAPGCSGSWVRESFTEDCRCPSYSMIFV
uniref:Si:dkey-178e17.3 n=1 Tax=Cyprinus carpio TaxID=7962 RepID=A0A8C2HKZ9_CYPCA